MGTKYIIDTSVAIKWITSDKEENIKEAHLLFRNIVEKNIEAISLDFLLSELTNVLLTGRKFTQEKIFAALDTVIDSSIKLVPVNIRLLKSAISLAAQYNQTIYDGLYLALAKQENAVVITADKKQARVADLSIPLWEYMK